MFARDARRKAATARRLGLLQHVAARAARSAWRAYSGSSRIVRIATASVGCATKHVGRAARLEPTRHGEVEREQSGLNSLTARIVAVRAGLRDNPELARLALQDRANAVANDRVVVGDDHVDGPVNAELQPPWSANRTGSPTASHLSPRTELTASSPKLDSTPPPPAWDEHESALLDDTSAPLAYRQEDLTDTIIS